MSRNGVLQKSTRRDHMNKFLKVSALLAATAMFTSSAFADEYHWKYRHHHNKNSNISGEDIAIGIIGLTAGILIEKSLHEGDDGYQIRRQNDEDTNYSDEEDQQMQEQVSSEWNGVFDSATPDGHGWNATVFDHQKGYRTNTHYRHCEMRNDRNGYGVYCQ